MKESSLISNRLRWKARTGRLITIGNDRWKWVMGKGGAVVAYAEDGRRALSNAWTIKGTDAYTFERGQRKRTSDGMLQPNEVAKWLAGQRLLSEMKRD